MNTGELLSPAPSSPDPSHSLSSKILDSLLETRFFCSFLNQASSFIVYTPGTFWTFSLPFLSDLTLLVLKQVLPGRVSSFWVEYLIKSSEVFPYPYSELLLFLTAFPCGLLVCLCLWHHWLFRMCGCLCLPLYENVAYGYLNTFYVHIRYSARNVGKWRISCCHISIETKTPYIWFSAVRMNFLFLQLKYKKEKKINSLIS